VPIVQVYTVVFGLYNNGFVYSSIVMPLSEVNLCSNIIKVEIRLCYDLYAKFFLGERWIFWVDIGVFLIVKR
jgi:hypothetical protein